MVINFIRSRDETHSSHKKNLNLQQSEKKYYIGYDWICSQPTQFIQYGRAQFNISSERGVDGIFNPEPSLAHLTCILAPPQLTSTHHGWLDASCQLS